MVAFDVSPPNPWRYVRPSPSRSWLNSTIASPMATRSNATLMPTTPSLSGFEVDQHLHRALAIARQLEGFHGALHRQRMGDDRRQIDARFVDDPHGQRKLGMEAEGAHERALLGDNHGL